MGCDLAGADASGTRLTGNTRPAWRERDRGGSFRWLRAIPSYDKCKHNEQLAMRQLTDFNGGAHVMRFFFDAAPHKRKGGHALLPHPKRVPGAMKF